MSLMVRPGINWDPSKPKEEEILQPKPIPAVSGLSANIQEISFEQRVRHSRTPSIVLSPSPSSDVPGATLEKDILLTLDPEAPASIETLTGYHTTVANPEFWVKLATFFRCVVLGGSIHPGTLTLVVYAGMNLLQKPMLCEPGKISCVLLRRR